MCSNLLQLALGSRDLYQVEKILAELLPSNPLDFKHEKNPREQPSLLAYCSLRNSQYNQEKMLVVPVDFFMVKIKRIGRL
jgi:hypothetical protein